MKGSLVVAAEAAKGIGLIIVTPSLGVESSVFMFTTLFLDWLGNKPGPYWCCCRAIRKFGQISPI